MEGRLQDIDLYQLVELLTQRPHVSEITLRRLDSEALIVVGAGELISARCGGLEGEDALFHVLGWKEGRFRVLEWIDDPWPPPPDG